MSNNIEIWKPVVGWEDSYMVSNLGRVKSLDRYVPHRNDGYFQFIKGKIRKTKFNNGGYEMITLKKNGKEKTCLVHRLVAEAFLPNSDNLPEVNHKDEDVKNNTLENLEWCDRIYNLHYGTAMQRRSEKIITPVIQFTLDGELIRKWDSMKDVENALGINRGNVSNACSGRCKSVGGSKWEYYDTDRYLIALMNKTIKERERAA
jgi:hypothetical protein